MTVTLARMKGRKGALRASTDIEALMVVLHLLLFVCGCSLWSFLCPEILSSTSCSGRSNSSSNSSCSVFAVLSIGHWWWWLLPASAKVHWSGTFDSVVHVVFPFSSILLSPLLSPLSALPLAALPPLLFFLSRAFPLPCCRIHSTVCSSFSSCLCVHPCVFVRCTSKMYSWFASTLTAAFSFALPPPKRRREREGERERVTVRKSFFLLFFFFFFFFFPLSWCEFALVKPILPRYTVTLLHPSDRFLSTLAFRLWSGTCK